MSSLYNRQCSGGCSRLALSRKHWMCPTCTDQKNAEEYHEYTMSPQGQLDDVSNLEELKFWIKEHLL